MFEYIVISAIVIFVISRILRKKYNKNNKNCGGCGGWGNSNSNEDSSFGVGCRKTSLNPTFIFPLFGYYKRIPFVVYEQYKGYSPLPNLLNPCALYLQVYLKAFAYLNYHIVKESIV